ncbi:MAG: DUF3047 domain-containing protein [Betaproteobacteria bacterium]|nr:DUF3047 domain-containing protein [Betaproteobacteria bacterium]
MRSLRHAAMALLAAGCLPALAASAGATAPCEPRDLGFDRADAGWKPQPISKLKRDTAYVVAKEDGRTVLRASADRSASFYAALFKAPVGVPAAVSWRWRTDALVPGADNRDKKREDAPLRVVVAFDGDPSRLPAEERRRMEAARKVAGINLPFAVLMYIWTDHVPLDTVIPSAHTGQVKMIAVATGKAGLGSWQSVRRDVAADYRRAFGADPGRVLGVGVMTDTDNTGTKAAGLYADIRLECAR